MISVHSVIRVSVSPPDVTHYNPHRSTANASVRISQRYGESVSLNLFADDARESAYLVELHRVVSELNARFFSEPTEAPAEAAE
jgi:hypothetical protein